jgi:hypothetical protein
MSGHVSLRPDSNTNKNPMATGKNRVLTCENRMSGKRPNKGLKILVSPVQFRLLPPLLSQRLREAVCLKYDPLLGFVTVRFDFLSP